MENESRFLEIWKQTLQERCLQLVHQAAKDVQEISEREESEHSAKQKPVAQIINLGGGALMMAFQPASPNATGLKERYSTAIETAQDDERMKTEGVLYANHIIEKMCGNKLITMDDLYKSSDPVILADLKDSLTLVDDFLSEFDHASFCLGENSSQDFQDQIDRSKLELARVLLPLLQNAINAQINGPAAKSVGRNKPSPWAS
jgi:hypothetical protein